MTWLDATQPWERDPTWVSKCVYAGNHRIRQSGSHGLDLLATRPQLIVSSDTKMVLVPSLLNQSAGMGSRWIVEFSSGCGWRTAVGDEGSIVGEQVFVTMSPLYDADRLPAW